MHAVLSEGCYGCLQVNPQAAKEAAEDEISKIKVSMGLGNETRQVQPSI